MKSSIYLKTQEQVQSRNLHFKTCFPVTVVFFRGEKRQIILLLKADFPTGTLTKSSQHESKPELEKKPSTQSAHTSTRIHHRPFLAFF